MTVDVRIVPAEKGVEIQAEYIFSAPANEVFNFFAVHENLSQVFGGKIQRIQEGSAEDPNGLGSVRRIWLGPGPSFEERIERYEPAQCIEYTVTRGSPVKNHYGSMQFTELAEGTRMNYRIRLQGRIPGTTRLIAKIMARSLSQGLPQANQAISQNH